MKKVILFLSLLISMISGYAETWTPVGKLKWYEGIITDYHPGTGKSWEATLERSDDRPYMFRSQIYAKTDECGPVNNSNSNVYVYVNTENHNRIYIDPFYVATYDKSGNHVYGINVSQRCPENGFDSNYYGRVQSDGVTILFPEEAFSLDYERVRESPAYPGTKNNSEIHKIVFPEGVLDFTPVEETWVDIGKGHWTDPFWSDANGDPIAGYLDFEKSTQNPDTYRIMPFIGQYIRINAENPAKVFISPYTVTNTNGEGITLTQNCIENGLSGNMYGTMNAGKITIPGNSFVITNANTGTVLTTDSYRDCVITLPDGFDNPLPEENGVFMGMIGFNDEISRKPISLLDEDSKDEFTSFVDNLQMGNATLLYYAVDQAISTMKAQSFPENLSNAVLLTFTDGLDQGSLAMRPEYRTSKGYADYLSGLVKDTQIQGHPLEAYAIGLMSEDVYNDELFMYNLQSIASKEANISRVSNIVEMQQKLTELFENLNKQTSQRVVTIKVPMMSHGDKYRFTLDHSKAAAANSAVWFEGEFNIDNMTLENITYNGFTSTSGTVLTARQEGIKLIFTLNDCRDTEGNILDVEWAGIDQWIYIPSHGVWNHNEENVKAEDIDIQNIRSSVAIMFAIDCSTSLGDLFPLVKSTANSFIDRLAGGEGTSTVSDTIDADTGIDILDPEVEIFNLQGIRVANPSTGIYICRKGDTVKKVVIK